MPRKGRRSKTSRKGSKRRRTSRRYRSTDDSTYVSLPNTNLDLHNKADFGYFRIPFKPVFCYATYIDRFRYGTWSVSELIHNDTTSGSTLYKCLWRPEMTPKFTGFFHVTFTLDGGAVKKQVIAKLLKPPNDPKGALLDHYDQYIFYYDQSTKHDGRVAITDSKSGEPRDNLDLFNISRTIDSTDWMDIRNAQRDRQKQIRFRKYRLQNIIRAIAIFNNSNQLDELYIVKPPGVVEITSYSNKTITTKTIQNFMDHPITGRIHYLNEETLEFYKQGVFSNAQQSFTFSGETDPAGFEITEIND